MFKFVLCAVFAVAAADPQWLVNPTFPGLLAPTTFTRTASSVISDPFLVPQFDVSHLIKKRAAPLLDAFVPPTYISNSWTPYSYLNTYLPHSPINYAHLIKKRSADWIAPASYIASAPVASTYVASTPLATTAVLPSTPYWSGYAGVLPWIKK